MWCPHCQSDVATELADDGQSLRCTACRGEVRPVFAPSLHPETLSARELLERWSSGDFLDNVPISLPPVGEFPPSAGSRRRSESAGDTPDERGSAARSSGKSRPKFRFDAAHPLEDIVDRQGADAEPYAPPADAVRATADADDAPGRRTDPAHAALSGPHFDVAARQDRPARSTNSESLWGQLLAYAGVGVLTIGTVLVLWGHFGNVPAYASTGWLVATGGQMLLFLGVVTLVSGGMQQTTQEVSQRVEFIGERILRIEHSTRDLLRGPHFGRASEHERSHALEPRQSQHRSRDRE